MIDTLFVCKANVQRSQVAEGLYNSYSKVSKSISCAGVEARKEKYNGKPEKIITSILLEDGIDLSKQNINYITDFNLNELNKLKRVIFLFNPINEKIIDKECLINGESVYEYFRNKLYIEIIIHEIQDPYKLSFDKTVQIYKQLNDFIKKLN
ncbi:MAG: hypothetical protein PHS49_03140 [Candidatus Gracilibacteria bacterium]|nr:hypothetical protein [Candidatus Gracilibacteria bacterium]